MKNRLSTKTRNRRRAFTLLQVLLVVAIITLLAGLTFGVFQSGRRNAQGLSCDARLKSLALALDAFRQEHGAYPPSLSELITKKYITDASLLHCPLDPRPTGSYEEYYIFRNARPNKDDPRDPSTLPLIICPFHEADGQVGHQVFRGSTQQFTTRPATLSEASSVTVERPGQQPISGRAGMALRGGDRVRTAAGGAARILFADSSYVTLTPNADVTVLQSFLDGHSSKPLYTIVKQQLGEVFFRVNHGSKFDVATPTATAGALGTKFRIKRVAEKWYLRVEESRVLCNTATGSEIYTPDTSKAALNGWNLMGSDATSPGDDDDSDGHHNHGDGGHRGHGDDD
jgi:type II secretory pathway pseudopilin PulG